MLKRDALYFYKRTIKPKESGDLKYYHHGEGVAGFSSPQSKGELLLHGTMDEIESYLKKTSNSKNLTGNGYIKRAISKGRLY